VEDVDVLTAVVRDIKKHLRTLAVTGAHWLRNEIPTLAEPETLLTQRKFASVIRAVYRATDDR
jgi:hypothetical protein